MKFLSFLTAACLIATPMAGTAQSIDPAEPESIVNYLSSNGYKALLGEDSEGDPLIRSATGGTNFSIYFYGCNAFHTGCDSLNFSTGFNMENGIPLATLNEWNRRQVVGRAFADEDQDPYLDQYVYAKGGLSIEVFKGILEEWEDALGHFESHIGW